MKQLGVSEVGSDRARCWEYLFFPSLEAANVYLNEQPDKTRMMVCPCNLEDIFVELTGHQLD